METGTKWYHFVGYFAYNWYGFVGYFAYNWYHFVGYFAYNWYHFVGYFAYNWYGFVGYFAYNWYRFVGCLQLVPFCVGYFAYNWYGFVGYFAYNWDSSLIFDMRRKMTRLEDERDSFASTAYPMRNAISSVPMVACTFPNIQLVRFFSFASNPVALDDTIREGLTSSPLANIVVTVLPIIRRRQFGPRDAACARL
ncbi:hypothetical protein CDAR_486011 [Caerostris darwini]|uniref:Uncharacterized protein n=1 Tax=Caerostris darwini TaxID=1538125 RepID=A0AAV4WIT8_9ARAC|nr:hypothetical protein CDAR_486011 [Caerostris darwini]